MNNNNMRGTPDDAQSPQASASTNSATRAIDCQSDGVSQETGAASSAGGTAEKFPKASRRRKSWMNSRVTKLLSDEDVQSALEHLASLRCHVGWRMPGYTYALFSVDTGLVKIGRTDKPEQRIVELQRSNAGVLRVLSIVHGSWAEALLHAAHADRRSHGEWFSVARDVIADIGKSCWGCAAFDVQRATDRAHLKRGHAMKHPFAATAGLRLP